MLTDDYVGLVADPTQATQSAFGDFALSDDLMLEAAGDGGEATSVFTAPVLDRIRTSD